MGETNNTIQLSAVLLEKNALRFTPAGIAVLEGKFRHESEVYEAGAMRKLEFDFFAVAFADVAIQLDKVQIPSKVNLSGFLAPRSMKTTKLVVHITEFEI